jgi:ATP-dependent Clp protease adapter protein ClpS
MVIHHKGKCVVKSMNDKETAETTVELLLDHGLDAELLNLSKK